MIVWGAMKSFLFFVVLLVAGPVTADSKMSPGRFFLEGDGQLTLVNKKTGQQATIRYRQPDGNYAATGVKEINRLFGVSAGSTEGIALRLVSLLDYLQDHFTQSCRGEPMCSPGQTHGSAPTIQIVSGYRSPTYNENLRKKGKLAARTSLHIEGMAADIDMAGVSGETLWHYIRDLNCCGAGFYHGKGIHVDTGPVRFWDETSTKVETDISSHNKMIMVRTDQDIYRPGETVILDLSRITDYPIGIKPVLKIVPLGLPSPLSGEESGVRASGHCQILPDRPHIKNLKWPLPEGLPEGKRLQVELELCDKFFPEMPDKITSNEFVVKTIDYH